jgi:hypothetical protein
MVVSPLQISLPWRKAQEQISHDHREAILCLFEQSRAIFTWSKFHIEFRHELGNDCSKLRECELFADTAFDSFTSADEH